MDEILDNLLCYKLIDEFYNNSGHNIGVLYYKCDDRICTNVMDTTDIEKLNISNEYDIDCFPVKFKAHLEYHNGDTKNVNIILTYGDSYIFKEYVEYYAENMSSIKSFKKDFSDDNMKFIKEL